MARGDWTELEGTWNQVTAATALGDHLYACSDHALWQIDADGAYAQVGDDEWHARVLVGVAGYLIAIDRGGAMVRIDPRDASTELLDGAWEHVVAACAGGEHLFVVERSGTLYRVSPADGAYEPLSDGYGAVTHVVAAGQALVTIESNGVLCRVSARDGTWERLSDGWAGVRAAAGDAAAAYVLAGENLYAIDPASGAHEVLTDTVWRADPLVAMAGSLYAWERSGGLFRIRL